MLNLQEEQETARGREGRGPAGRTSPSTLVQGVTGGGGPSVRDRMARVRWLGGRWVGRVPMSWVPEPGHCPGGSGHHRRGELGVGWGCSRSWPPSPPRRPTAVALHPRPDSPTPSSLRAARGQNPHQRKSESWHGHTWDVSADVKFLPLTHHDVTFLFRKLLRWPMRQPSPCSGSVGWGN